jgi:hypothetical protein
VAIVHGRKGEVMIARDEFERIRRVGLEALEATSYGWLTTARRG